MGGKGDEGNELVRRRTKEYENTLISEAAEPYCGNEINFAFGC